MRDYAYVAREGSTWVARLMVKCPVGWYSRTWLHATEEGANKQLAILRRLIHHIEEQRKQEGA